MTQLISGREKEPIVMVCYGEPGSGKSSFAAGAHNPVFVGPERNKELNVFKFPRVLRQGQLLGYLREIESGKHDRSNIRTVVLDAISTQEEIIREEILAKEPGKTMQTACGGFGKANEQSLKQLIEIRDGLDAIINKKEMNVIVLSHCIKNDFNDPMLMTNYDSYEIALHKGKNKDHSKVFVNWASSVLFLHWKHYATEDKKHATGIGKRVIRTECRPSHIAKNRYNFPETIEMLDDSEILKTGQKPQTFAMVERYIDDFYQSGAKPNLNQNNTAILMMDIKNNMNKLNDQNLIQTISNAVLSSASNYNELNIINNRILEILNQQ